MKIGFIGLGNMGAPMSSNLVAANFDVKGYDIAAPCPPGVVQAASLQDVVVDRDVVITMLPDGHVLRTVADEIVASMHKDAVFVDCSTVDVESARTVAGQAQKAGIQALDAPVSGGVVGAQAGSLTFMAGGSAQTFERILPLFNVMGQKAVHCGETGNGQAAKICNNMIAAVTMIATCESFALADQLGLARDKLYDVVSTSSGSSWSILNCCPAPGVGGNSPADNDYKPGFASDLMLKDLRLSQDAAQQSGADTPMGRVATDLYAQFVEHEDGSGLDMSAILLRFEKNN